MLDQVSLGGLPHRVVQEFTIPKTRKRADLALLGPDGMAELVVEFKYEPDHGRLTSGQIPVVFWSEVTRDVERVQHPANEKHARRACSVFIDEGGYYRGRRAPFGSRWEDWDTGQGANQVAVLICEA